MLKASFSRPWRIAAVVAGVLLALLTTAIVRIGAGPIAADWLKPGLEKSFAAQTPGGAAHIDQVSLVWFGREGALGLRLEGLNVTDVRQRRVLSARRLEGALALGGLWGFQFTPGRLTADRFFAAVTVSPQGRYAIGYEPAPPSPPSTAEQPMALDRLLLELTGKSRPGRRFSFLRTLSLTNGQVTLHQAGGGPAWTADIRVLNFSKLADALETRADIVVQDPQRPAVLHMDGKGAIGLSDAYLRGDVSNLSPARIFPSVGPTAALSALDAVVQGHGSVAYDFRSGVRAADLSVEAGEGKLKYGAGVQAFKSARIVANYAPNSGEVLLSTFKIEAERTRLDVTGAFKLTPQDDAAHTPAKLEFRVAGPRFAWRFADDAPPQDLNNLVVRGRLIPSARRLEFDQADAFVGDAALTARGAFFRDKHDLLGAKVDAQIRGQVGPDPIFAFWPAGFVHGVRDYLRHAILDARFTGVQFHMDAMPGHLRSDGLQDEDLKLQFAFDKADFRFADSFPTISDGVGKAVLQGNRFDLDLETGRMGDIALSQGAVIMPTFHEHGADAIYRFVAKGGVRNVLATLDGPKLHLISDAGFDWNRTSGEAAVKVEVRRPMLFEVPKKDIKIAYEGVIQKGGLTQAALGWDLENANLRIKGDERRFALDGKGAAGPYKGDLEFQCQYGDGERIQQLTLNGAIDVGIIGGPAGRSSPFGGHFSISKGGGQGNVRSGVFNGHIDWKDGDGRDRFVMDGTGDGVGLRKAGAPFTAGLPDRFSAQARFDRAGDVWRGPVKADALSGTVAFTAGAKPRLVYEADINPAKARKLGLSDIPYFAEPRRVLIDAGWTGPAGSADVRSGGLSVQLAWDRGEHSLKASLWPSDLTALGLPPLSAGNTPVPVKASWRSTGDRIAGSGQAAETAFRFQTAPTRGGQVLLVTAELDRNTLKRLGLPSSLHMDGAANLLARFDANDKAPAAGRIDVDLTRADLSIEGSDWRKPMGRPGRATADFVKDASGAVRLSRVSVQSDGLDVQGSALVMGGKVEEADFSRVRLAGFLDASVKAGRDSTGGELSLTVRGRQLDARRWFTRGAQSSRGSAGPAPTPSVTISHAVETFHTALKVDAAFEAVRLTEDARLQDVHMAGAWGGPSAIRMDVSAQTVNGGKLHGRLFPQNGEIAVAAETTDAGEVARALFGVKGLKGGHAIITGHLVDNGADLNVDIHDVRVIHAPAMAQLLTVASFKGLADTLNGEGVMFNHVVAPVQIRGSRLTLNSARATGSALGITAEGMADMDGGRMEIHGTLAPAYSLNSAMGSVPVVGQLLTSRKGEGVFGLGYYAKGPIDKPQVMVNPLSLMTPGILRRMFEGGSPSAAAPPQPPPPPAGSKTGGGSRSGGEF